MPMPTDPEMARIRGYLQAQAAKLTIPELADKVRADLDQFRAALDAIPADSFSTTPAEGEWSANEICAHLAHTSLDVGNGIRAVLDRGEQPQRVRDQMGATTAERTADAWWQELLSEREAILERVRAAKGDEHLDIAWDHPFFGPLNWREWVLFLRVHDLDHARQLQAIAAG